MTDEELLLKNQMLEAQQAARQERAAKAAREREVYEAKTLQSCEKFAEFLTILWSDEQFSDVKSEILSQLNLAADAPFYLIFGYISQKNINSLMVLYDEDRQIWRLLSIASYLQNVLPNFREGRKAEYDLLFSEREILDGYDPLMVSQLEAYYPVHWSDQVPLQLLSNPAFFDEIDSEEGLNHLDERIIGLGQLADAFFPEEESLIADFNAKILNRDALDQPHIFAAQKGIIDLGFKILTLMKMLTPNVPILLAAQRSDLQTVFDKIHAGPASTEESLSTLEAILAKVKEEYLIIYELETGLFKGEFLGQLQEARTA
jgi:hypothetical protein